MGNEDVEKLEAIADILDEHFLEVYKNNHKHGFIMHWCADEIRKVINKEGK